MGHWASNGRSKSVSDMSFLISIGDSRGEDNGVDAEAHSSASTDEGNWKYLEVGDVPVEPSSVSMKANTGGA